MSTKIVTALHGITTTNDHGSRLVNQPRLIIDKCWKTTVGNKISTVVS